MSRNGYNRISLMPFDFEIVQKLINSSLGQVATGAAFAGIVWKFFEKVEGILSDATKFEIAVWLVGVEVGKKVEPWPKTFAQVFENVFGQKHLSWKCFCWSGVFSFCVFTIVSAISTWVAYGQMGLFVSWVTNSYKDVLNCVGAVASGYGALLITRNILTLLGKTNNWSMWLVLIVFDFCLTSVFAIIAIVFWGSISNSLLELHREYGMSLTDLTTWSLLPDQAYYMVLNGLEKFWDGVRPTLFVPSSLTTGEWLSSTWPHYASALSTSVWLWLYAGSGFILKSAKRFDIGFQWFNSKADIEKNHCLQSALFLVGS